MVGESGGLEALVNILYEEVNGRRTLRHSTGRVHVEQHHNIYIYIYTTGASSKA